MVFSSSIFLLLFLPAVYLLNLIIIKLSKNRTAASNVFLLLASLVFYAWGEPVLVLLMIGSIVLNWFCGLMISRAQPPVVPALTADQKAAHGLASSVSHSGSTLRRFWLAVAVVGDLAMLGYFKYAGFLTKTLNGLFGREILSVPEIALPIGISFFTFQAISYVVDVCRGTTEASKNPINTALYISFFPQLIAGPIVKYRDVNRQIESRTLTPVRLADGFRRFTYGLGKKVLIANVLGLCVDKIYSYNIGVIDPLAAWIAAIAYAFQIYYDFSGYSDMAIGLGKMFGFDYLENFNYPYLSKSVGEFWRRWHISLGAWFREYVYIPLGGNRKGRFRTYVNLGIVFLLTGLWHGADVSFILWGAWHGFFVIIERLCLRKFLDKHRILGWVYCCLVVLLGWVFFRAGDTMTGITLLVRMIRPWHYQIAINWKEYLEPKTIAVFAAAVLGAGMLKWLIPDRFQKKWLGSMPEAVFCVILLVLSLAAIAGDTYNPFIYFQF